MWPLLGPWVEVDKYQLYESENYEIDKKLFLSYIVGRGEYLMALNI